MLCRRASTSEPLLRFNPLNLVFVVSFHESSSEHFPVVRVIARKTSNIHLGKRTGSIQLQYFLVGVMTVWIAVECMDAIVHACFGIPVLLARYVIKGIWQHVTRNFFLRPNRGSTEGRHDRMLHIFYKYCCVSSWKGAISAQPHTFIIYLTIISPARMGFESI